MILDLGCGPNKMSPDYIGIDHYPFPNVDIVRDLTRGLPFSDNTADAIFAKHILEHFDGEDLIFIVEEMCRVCKNESIITVVLPSLGSPNCGKDFTHRKKDWDEWSFQMWEKRNGEYIIERGPMYGIVGELKILETKTNNNNDRIYIMTNVK